MAVTGLAGCSSSSDGEDDDGADDGTEDENSSSGDDTGGSEEEMEGSENEENIEEETGESASPNTGTPEEFTQTFYKTLYADADIEGANALYHPESPAPAVKAEDFEDFGGLEAMGASVESTEVVSEGEGQAVVHTDVEYTTPAGSAVDTDYLYLRREGEQWQMNVWFPETPREQAAIGTAEEFYQTLYNDNDIEAANEMYHPESEAPDIKAEDFEDFGGLEAMEATVQETELVSEGGGEAEVHLDVEYTTPAGTGVDTDYVFLKLQGPQWKIDRWLPEAVREEGS